MGKKGILLLLLIVAAIGLAASLCVSPFVVDGHSMMPTLANGERVLVNTVAYRWRDPRPGEIIVFYHPNNPDTYFVKRIAAVGGDVVEVRDWIVYVNGRMVQEDYIWGPTYGTIGPVIVPEGRLFVLGDNRNHSEDSRFVEMGTVPVSSLIGRAVVLYWPLRRFKLLAAHASPLLRAYDTYGV